MPNERLCDECSHPIRLHDDPYGCQHERGDQVVGEVLMAMGPCGCRAWTVGAIRDMKAATPRPLVYLCALIVLTGALLAALDLLRGVPWSK
jgi:hypothetical protein